MLLAVSTQSPVAFDHTGKVYEGLEGQQGVGLLLEQLQEADQKTHWVPLEGDEVLVCLLPGFGGGLWTV